MIITNWIGKMMEKLDYLYYKLYRAHLKGSLSDIAEFAALVLFSLLIFENLFVLAAFLKKVSLLPLFFTNKQQVILSFILLFACKYFLFFYKKRYKRIIAKYEKESEREQKRGNRAVWMYVVISFVLMLLVAFYKPGKL